jgi:site-specific DNA-adenine methylase
MSTLIPSAGGKGRLRHHLMLALHNAAGGYRLPFREVFLGGGAVGLYMIEKDRADTFWLNDKDASLVCFWKAVQELPNLLMQHVDRMVPPADATKQQWRCTLSRAFLEAKHVLAERSGSRLGYRGGLPTDPALVAAIGFLKLVIHRLSFGGFGMNSYPRGGMNQDSPSYWDNGRYRNNKIDARWSPPHIQRQIWNINAQLNRIKARITNLDFESVIADETEQALLFCDPPYLQEGPQCYYESMTLGDHSRLAALLKRTGHKWILTYGDCPEIREMYHWARITEIVVESCTKHEPRQDLIITRS